MEIYNSIEEVKVEEFKKTEVICVDGVLKVVKDGKIENLTVKVK